MSGTIVNPTIARPAGAYPYSNIPWDLEYALKSSVSLTSVTGDVSLYGYQSSAYYYGPFDPATSATGVLTDSPPYRDDYGRPGYQPV